MDKEREKCAEILKKTGVPENLINTPAIFENCFENYCKKEKKENIRAVVPKDNEFTFLGTKYVLKDDNTLEESYADFYDPKCENYAEVLKEEKLNKYGIAEKCSYSACMYGGLDFGSSNYVVEREKGKIITGDGLYCDKIISIDSGVIDLNSQASSSARKKEEKIDLKSTLDTFDKNAKDAVENYPQLEEYYDELRKDVISELKDQYLSNIDSFIVDDDGIQILGITDEDYRKKLTELSEQLDEANEKNKKLKRDNTSLASKLKSTLEFCEDVKNSKFGSLFFGRKIKKLNGIQEQQEER